MRAWGAVWSRTWWLGSCFLSRGWGRGDPGSSRVWGDGKMGGGGQGVCVRGRGNCTPRGPHLPEAEDPLGSAGHGPGGGLRSGSRRGCRGASRGWRVWGHGAYMSLTSRCPPEMVRPGALENRSSPAPGPTSESGQERLWEVCSVSGRRSSWEVWRSWDRPWAGAPCPVSGVPCRSLTPGPVTKLLSPPRSHPC